jgi:hypothetical protein
MTDVSKVDAATRSANDEACSLHSQIKVLSQSFCYSPIQAVIIKSLSFHMVSKSPTLLSG